MQASVKILKSAADRLLAALALMLALSPVALADPQPNNSQTTLTFSANPAPLEDGKYVTIATTTTATASSGPTAATISAGKIIIQYYATSEGEPVPAGTAGANWVDFNPPGKNPDGNGVTTLNVDLKADPLNAIPGMVIGFRAHYITGGGSARANSHFSPAADLTVAPPA